MELWWRYKGKNQWNTVMNTCVSVYKNSSSSVTPRSDNRCGPDFGNTSCHSGYYNFISIFTFFK